MSLKNKSEKTLNKCIWIISKEPCSGKTITRFIFKGQISVPMCIHHYACHLKRAAIVYSKCMDGEKALGLDATEVDSLFNGLPQYKEAQAIIVSALYGSTADLDSMMDDLF